MQISAYQIHNVLNAYSLRYFKLISESSQTDDENDSVDTRMSPQEKRHYIIEKVASDIVSRITSLDSLSAIQSSLSDIKQQEPDNAERVFIKSEPGPNNFAFNSLDTGNVKTFKTISIEDSIFLIKQDLNHI